MSIAPKIESKEFLPHCVKHFIDYINRPEIKDDFHGSKYLWAISQVYRSWEIHKEKCKELNMPPRFNNDDIIKELQKHFNIKLL